MILLSASLSKSDKMKQFSDDCFYVTFKVKKSEWMSGKSDTVGLDPKWSQQRVKLEYKEPSNLIYITLRGQHSSEVEICSARVEVGVFLDKNQTLITVPVFRDDVVVGDVKFELMG